MNSKSHFAIVLLLSLLTAPAWAQRAGTVFKDCAGCPDMVAIPGGSFEMGTPRDPVSNSRTAAEEQPQHKVTLKPFALGRYEVTQAQWRMVMDANPSKSGIGPSLPVESVSWDEVQVFLGKLGAKTGKTYRLPTEAEWEYAARAGSTTIYSFGSNSSRLAAHGWYRDNAKGKTHPVGLKRPNRFGLYDMHGNVWEWVQDCYIRNYANAPTDGSAAAEHEMCSRVNRGGSWRAFPEFLRSAARVRDLPIGRLDDLGFRVARSLP